MADILFDYNPALISHVDWVRYYLGQTDPARNEIDQREILALLNEQPEPEPDVDDEAPTAAQWRSYRVIVAARAAEAIAARHAQDSDVTFESQRVAMSSKFAQFSALAKRLRSLAMPNGGQVRVVRA